MHVRLGRYNQLEVVKEVDFGVYLDGGDDGEILLPTRYVPEDCQPGDMLNVFIYLDNEERLVATTLTPYAQVGDFACLEVAWTNQYGAFLDWGLMKDLFVPFREQKNKMEKGERYVVHVHLDEDSYRIMASAKVERYLSNDMPPYHPGDGVEILVWQRTDLGYKVIVDNLPFLLSDTVGFIRKLPTELVESFKSTLDEVREADLLVHVVDISHPSFEEQIDVVNKTLTEIDKTEKPMIMVFNKVDAFTFIPKDEDDLTPRTRENISLDELKQTWMSRMQDSCIFISAKQKLNIEELKEMLYEKVKEIHITRFPYNDFLFQKYDENE